MAVEKFKNIFLENNTKNIARKLGHHENLSYKNCNIYVILKHILITYIHFAYFSEKLLMSRLVNFFKYTTVLIEKNRKFCTQYNKILLKNAENMKIGKRS